MNGLNDEISLVWSRTGLVDSTLTCTTAVGETGHEYKEGFQVADISDKLEKHLADPHVLASNKALLESWCELEQRPCSVIDVYSVPAVSSQPESGFSRVKFTVSDQRNSVKGEEIELLECVKSWFRLGILVGKQFHAIVIDLREDEAIEALNYESGLIQVSRTESRTLGRPCLRFRSSFPRNRLHGRSVHVSNLTKKI